MQLKTVSVKTVRTDGTVWIRPFKPRGDDQVFSFITEIMNSGDLAEAEVPTTTDDDDAEINAYVADSAAPGDDPLWFWEGKGFVLPTACTSSATRPGHSCDQRPERTFV